MLWLIFYKIFGKLCGIDLKNEYFDDKTFPKLETLALTNIHTLVGDDNDERAAVELRFPATLKYLKLECSILTFSVIIPS